MTISSKEGALFHNTNERVIGGQDIVFPAVGDPASLEACARIVARHWPQVRFEDAVTGEKYRHLADIPFGRVRELLAYPSAEAEAAWDADRPDSPENSMLHVIVRPEDVTVVLDNPQTAEMRSILDAIRDLLKTGLADPPRVERPGSDHAVPRAGDIPPQRDAGAAGGRTGRAGDVWQR